MLVLAVANVSFENPVPDGGMDGPKLFPEFPLLLFRVLGEHGALPNFLVGLEQNVESVANILTILFKLALNTHYSEEIPLYQHLEQEKR